MGDHRVIALGEEEERGEADGIFPAFFSSGVLA